MNYPIKKIKTDFGGVSIYQDKTVSIHVENGFLMLNAESLSISPNQEPNYVIQLDKSNLNPEREVDAMTFWFGLHEDQANQIIAALESLDIDKFSGQTPYWKLQGGN